MARSMTTAGLSESQEVEMNELKSEPQASERGEMTELNPNLRAQLIRVTES